MKVLPFYPFFVTVWGYDPESAYADCSFVRPECMIVPKKAEPTIFTKATNAVKMGQFY